MQKHQELAINKLNEELEASKSKEAKLSNKASAIIPFVHKALTEFSKNELFAISIHTSDKTLSDCCNEIMKKTGQHISDNEVYMKAAQFYMPEATVNFVMELRILVGTEKTIKQHNDGLFETTKSVKRKLDISLDDLL